MTQDEALDLIKQDQFIVTDHAVESFRIRISGVSKRKAKESIRFILRDTVCGMTENVLKVRPDAVRGSWTIKCQMGRSRYHFWAAVGPDDDNPESKVVVRTVYNPRRVEGQRVDLSTHYHEIDELKRQNLRLEDKLYEMAERFSQNGQPTNGRSSNAGSDTNSGFDTAGTDPDVAEVAHEEGQE